MRVKLHEFNFGVRSDLVTPSSANFRPPSWPPSRDWPVVIDKDGAVVSRWGDPRWNLAPWYGKLATLNFGDGDEGIAEHLDSENADLLRMVATWLIWGRQAPGSVATVLVRFSYVRQIAALCSRNGISAAQLTRFPKVLERLPEVISASRFEPALALLQRLYDDRELLGFTIVDSDGMRRLAAAAPDHEIVQTAYIPPRIWVYQVKRLHECVTDFLSHGEQVAACFRYCLEAYIANYGSLETALLSNDRRRRPFNAKSKDQRACTYHGKFAGTAAHFGIADLLVKWVATGDEGHQVDSLSTYMSLVTYGALAYIANFTLQRKEEVAALRASCLQWEEDEKLGRVPIICGQTTKTDPDSDARWVASPGVEDAVKAAALIARLRTLCERGHPHVRLTAADQEDPYLFSTATEPWGAAAASIRPYYVRRPLLDLGQAKVRYPLLFDQEQLRMSGDDLQVARRLTPNLRVDAFAVGKVWPLAWHQYRRTGAVNMFASGIISDSSMQQQMKHSSRLMPLYYGRNHTRLRLSDEVRGAVIRAMYETQAQTVKHAVSSDRFVSPHSTERKEALAVNVLSAKDLKALAAMAKKGTISFREHRLGGCMKSGACEYGGIESVSRCAGGDGGKPCTDVLFGRSKELQVRSDLDRLTKQIELLPEGQPRYKALVEERRAMENYLNVVSGR